MVGGIVKTESKHADETVKCRKPICNTDSTMSPTLQEITSQPSQESSIRGLEVEELWPCFPFVWVPTIQLISAFTYIL